MHYVGLKCKILQRPLLQCFTRRRTFSASRFTAEKNVEKDDDRLLRSVKGWFASLYRAMNFATFKQLII